MCSPFPILSLILCIPVLLLSCDNRQTVAIPKDVTREDTTGIGKDIFMPLSIPIWDTGLKHNENRNYSIKDVPVNKSSRYVFIPTNQWPYYNMIIVD